MFVIDLSDLLAQFNKCRVFADHRTNDIADELTKTSERLIPFCDSNPF